MDLQFENEFKRLRDLGPDVFTLRGPTILVEMIPPEEMKTQGGLIIVGKDRSDVVTHKLEHGVVLMVGQGTWDDEKREYVSLDVKPGQVVVMPQFSQQVISTWPGLQRPLQNKLALVSAGSILGTYSSQEAFDVARKQINS